jgi:hypothetical protein
LCIGAGIYLLVLLGGDGLLRDPDSFWHIKVGQWILDHHALPHTDIYSFTRFGQPWISTAWLSQVLFALAYAQWAWAGPVVLTAIVIACSVAIFVHWLNRLGAHLEIPHSAFLAVLAFGASAPHLLTRPHILALPVMVIWGGMLMAAADRKSSPSWLWLPLMALWANLHGGFVLGLALIGPIALEAVWNVEAPRRPNAKLFLRWVLFGIGALVASCATPYGWKTLLGATNILNLGKALTVIGEWKPSNFTSFSVFEGALLGLIAIAFSRRIVLSPPRILLVLLLTWMALTHVRSVDSFAFLMPLVLAKPLGELSRQVGQARQVEPNAGNVTGKAWSSHYVIALATLTIVAVIWASTAIRTSHHGFTFAQERMPIAAMDWLEQHKAQRIFNGYNFGGYLIWRNVPVFIDGRAELYGETFVMDVTDAVEIRKLDNLTRLLDEYQIDATLLIANAPAAQVLDHMKGWKRLYADDIAVVHVRDDR